MKRIILPIVALLAAVSGMASSRITATLTVTNVPAAAQTLVVNSSTRTWVTNVTSAGTQVLVDAAIGGATTNLWNNVTRYQISGITAAWNATNRFSLAAGTDVALTVTATGWGSVTYSTQTVATLQTVRVPLASEPEVVRTNAATLLAKGLGDYSLVPISQISTAASELVGKTNTQTVSGAKTWTGANVFVGGVTTSNLVNQGAAVSSPGSGYLSEQFGTGTTATGQRAVAIGYTATADGNNSVAVGYGAYAADSGGVAVRGAAYGINGVTLGGVANGVSSTALANSTADGDYSIAIGDTASAAGDYSVAIGYGVSVSTDHYIQLGTASETVVVPGPLIGSGSTYLTSLNATSGTLTNGVYSSPRLTNSTVHASWLQGTLSSLSGGYLNGSGATNLTVTNLTATGTLSLGGIVQFPQATSTSLANGNNAAVSPGSGVYLKLLSGPTGAFSINGISGGASGRLLYIQNGTGQTMTIANDSGVDPTAANRIYTGRAADLAVTNGNFIVTLIYDAHASRWVVVSP